MAADKGVRDGEFVKFSGWDLPGEDQAYIPNLQGRVSDLKKVVLEKSGSLFLAFNTNGWIKSWAILDFNKFKPSNSDLYVRVEYPGWHFIQGMDSPSNDLEPKITDVSTSTGLRETVTKRYSGDNKVAAFNTNGWIKTKVKYPLVKVPGNPSSLSGIYIRTTFLDFSFYALKDSPSGDIKKTSDFADDVPNLIKETVRLSNSGGFNTNGWHKHTLEGPPPQDTPSTFSQDYQGIYYRTSWPDFIYLPGLDSPYNDIRNVGNKQLHELLDEARKDPNAIAANTDGWLKNKLVDSPQPFPGEDRLKGIYVKYIDPSQWSAITDTETKADQSTLLYTALFALKGTMIICSYWLFSDAKVRADYNEAVSSAATKILNRAFSGEITYLEGAEEAHSMRNSILIGSRARTSPPGLFIARALKPAGGQYDYYLNKNAQARYGKAFEDLNEAQSQVVAVDTIESAGRANPQVTGVMKKIGKLSKGIMGIAIAISVYQVATAPDWEVEMGRQVTSWSGAIVGGEFGAGVGSIVGPVGAVLGGIIGGILGGMGAAELATWFFGGSSGLRAEDLLGPALGPASELVDHMLSSDGHGYYTHIIRAEIYGGCISEGRVNHAALRKMVEDTPEGAGLRPDNNDNNNEVLATVVWIRVAGRMLPVNARNPGDMVKLMEYIKKNLPT